jgi:hypothetical protein
MMTVIVGPGDRASILRYASWLLDAAGRESPVRVAATAVPLLEWAEQAADEDDLRSRMRAMSRQHDNNNPSRPVGPARFVDDACTLYAFLVAGGSGR